MKPTLQAIFAIILLPGDMYLDNGLPNSKSVFKADVIMKFYDFVKANRFNATYIHSREKSLGSALKDGSYDGTTGFIYRGEAHTYYYPYPLSRIRGDKLKYGPVVRQFEYVIYSVSTSNAYEEPNIALSLLLFDRWTSLAILCIMLAFYLTCRHLQLTKPFMILIESLLMQNFSFPLKALFVLTILIFFLQTFFNAGFGTEMTSAVDENRIEDFKDLAQAKACPAFFGMMAFHRSFQESSIETYRRVWTKAESCSPQSAVMNPEDTQAMIAAFGQMIREEVAFVGERFMRQIIKQTMCSFHYDLLTKRSQSGAYLVISKPLLNALSTLPMHINISWEIQERIQEMSYNLLELGYMDYMFRLMDRVVPIPGSNEFFCAKREYNQREEVKGPNIFSIDLGPIGLKPRHFAYIAYGFSGSMLFALIVLITEMIVIEVRNAGSIEEMDLSE